MSVYLSADFCAGVDFYGEISKFYVWMLNSKTVTVNAGSVINYLQLPNGSNVDLYGEVTSTIDNSSMYEYYTTVNIYEGAVSPKTYSTSRWTDGELFIINDYRL